HRRNGEAFQRLGGPVGTSGRNRGDDAGVIDGEHDIARPTGGKKRCGEFQLALFHLFTILYIQPYTSRFRCFFPTSNWRPWPTEGFMACSRTAAFWWKAVASLGPERARPHRPVSPSIAAGASSPRA